MFHTLNNTLHNNLHYTLAASLLERIQRMIVRGLLVLGLAIILATTFVVMQEPTPIFAASSAAANASRLERTDRRPDRERPVKTTKSTTTNGDSHGQSSNGARPRLVRK
jgi:hypothetical protein